MNFNGRMFGVVCILLSSLVLLAACRGREEEKEVEEISQTLLEIKSSAFEDGGDIPVKFTCDGQNISPPLSWSSPPEGTQSLVLICDDPDAPMGTWVHWVLFGLSPETLELPEGVPPHEVVSGSVRQGANDFGKIGYGGPCPPRGPAHRYYFKLYALDFSPNLGSDTTKQELLKAIRGHVLAQGELIGRYGR